VVETLSDIRGKGRNHDTLRLRGQPDRARRRRIRQLQIPANAPVKIFRAREVREVAVGAIPTRLSDEVLGFRPMAPGVETERRPFAPQRPQPSRQAQEMPALVDTDHGPACADDRFGIRQGLRCRHEPVALAGMALHEFPNQHEGNDAVAVAREDGEKHRLGGLDLLDRQRPAPDRVGG
jgi:hypothetical protein